MGCRGMERDLRAPTLAGASRTPEGAEQDKGRGGREGGQEPAASKAPRAGVGSGAARAVQGFATASGESCARGFCSGPPPPVRHFKVGAKVGAARDSRDPGSESRRSFALHPLRADRRLLRAFLTSLPDSPRKPGVGYASGTHGCASDRTGGDFSLCPVLPELPRRPGLLAPWAWESRLHAEQVRAEAEAKAGERPEAEVQQFAESRGSEASPSPTPGRDTAVDPGHGWTGGNSGSVQRAARGRRVADKNTSKDPEPQKSSPGWLGVTPTTAVPREAWPALVPPAPQGLLCFQISHRNAGCGTPLSSGGGQALGSVGSLLPSFPRGWAQSGLQGQASARSAPGANGSGVAAQPAPCETRPPHQP